MQGMAVRRTLRSAASSSQISREFDIPNSLPATGTIEARSVKRFKREHEDAAYAELRKSRGAAPIPVDELRGEWQRLLLPSRGSAHAEGSESLALAVEAQVPDVPPLFLSTCCGSEAAQQLLVRELMAIIAKEEWLELWLLLGQMSVCIEQMARQDAIKPWWVRQAQEAGGLADVVERVDLVAPEEPGNIDAPLDVTTAAQPTVNSTVKLEGTPELEGPQAPAEKAEAEEKAKAEKRRKTASDDKSDVEKLPEGPPFPEHGDWSSFFYMVSLGQEYDPSDDAVQRSQEELALIHNAWWHDARLEHITSGVPSEVPRTEHVPSETPRTGPRTVSNGRKQVGGSPNAVAPREEEANREVASLPLVSFSTETGLGRIHGSVLQHTCCGNIAHLKDVELRRVALPIPEETFEETFEIKRLDDGTIDERCISKPSTRRLWAAQYEWRPQGKAHWLPARLEWTEAVEDEYIEDEVEIKAPGLKLHLRLPAGFAPATVKTVDYMHYFANHFEVAEGKVKTRDPKAGLTETLWLCRADDAEESIDLNSFKYETIGWMAKYQPTFG